MKYDDKIMALAKFLKVKPSLIENGYSDYFTVNERTIKVGPTPYEIQKTADNFRKLLTEKMVETVTNAILGIRNADEVYKEVEKYLEPIAKKAKIRKELVNRSNLITPKNNIEDIYNQLQEENLYVSNVLYHLLRYDEHSGDYQSNLRRAWLCQPVNDIRKDEVVNDGEYIVLTDEEADDWEEEGLRSLFQDMKYEVPVALRQYIDEDRFVDDNSGDRGSNINGYDGTENSQEYNGETYYIYRSN